MKYPWKRFWCPREGKLNLSDGGFLYDPESEYAKLAQPDVVPFERIAERPCLALLGEPGVGKTTVMEELREALAESLGSAGDRLLYVNLNEYGDESRLIRDLFGCEEFTAWKSGTHVLHVFLDSLDECRIQIPQVATLLSNRLRQLRDHLKRLRLRIACRTFDWPPTLETTLLSLWGPESFGAYELAFLRRRDVQVSAEEEKIPADTFIEELTRTETVPLAIKPVTLRMLLSVFKKDGRLPSTRGQLYEQGCALLCEELNLNRRDLHGAKGVGGLSVRKRLDVASRIAAVSIFCGRPSVFTGVSSGAEEFDQVVVSDLAVGQTLPKRGEGEVSEDDVRDVLGTGLFSSRGSGWMGFAHQTYAEYLASRYLGLHQVDTPKILQLLQHPGDSDGRVAPQLYAVTAWIADQNGEVFDAVARHDPQVLLRCDEGMLTESQREELVESLLQALNEGRANNRDWGLWRHYHKLDHPRLADQLQPWVADQKRYWMARDAAVDIAEACKVMTLQGALADLTLNKSEAESLRSNAAHALAAVGDTAARACLRPLAVGSGEDDPMDQLKGNALRALWPDLITADELFENLTLPKRRNYHGAYAQFVEFEVAEHLDVKSLPTALKWLRKEAANRDSLFPFARLADDIMTLAWQNMEDTQVLQALAETCLELLKHHQDWIRDKDRRNEHASLFEGTEARRRLAEAIVTLGLDARVRFRLVRAWYWPRLLRETDLDWCLTKLQASVGQPIESAWANVVWSLFRAAEVCGNMLDVFISAREESPELEEVSRPFFTPTVLGSDEAKNLQEQYEDFLDPKARHEPKPLDWLPRDRIEHWLTRFENGEQDAWWVLVREMTLEDTSEQYERLFEPDITNLPGWRNSDSTTHARILEAARVYLNGRNQFDAAHLLDGGADERDIAGYKAFLVLLKEASVKLESLPDSMWCYWLPVLFGPFGHRGDEDIQKELIGVAHQKAPEAVADHLEQVLRHQIGKGDQHISCFDLVEGIWDHRISDKVRGLLETAEATPFCWRQLLHALLAHGDEAAGPLAQGKLSLPLPQEENPREIAVQAALVLVDHRDNAAWPLLWPKVKQDSAFGRRIVMEISYRLHHTYGVFFSKLNEGQLADLYIWLVQQFPYSGDPNYDGVHSPTKEDSARDLRNAAINALEKEGTGASCQAIQRIMETLPTLDWLKSILVEARRNTLQSTWRPLDPHDFLQITSEPDSRLVRDSCELQELLVDMLQSLEALLQAETPAAPDLWDERDKRVFSPKDENHFSDWVKRQLDSEVKKRGIVVAREVQIRRGEGTGVGEATDIHATATVPGLISGSFDAARVIIEVKGCWHKELKKAMVTQLVQRYLKDNQCQHGIYLVGWYVCAQWDDKDYRKQTTPKWTLQEAAEYFDQQAGELSVSGPSVRAVVLNTALR